MTDRSPKPCHHKVANHQHGTSSCYVLDLCRCPPCTVANTEANSHRARQQAYGRYDVFTDAAPVREHVRELMAAGMGLKRIIAVSGVPSGTLWKLVYGKRNAAGVQTPSRRCKHHTARRILGTGVDLAAGALTDVEANAAARTRLRALVALGWSMSNIADRLGVLSSNMRHLFHDTGVTFTAKRVRAAEALFDELSMAIPPRGTLTERQVFSRSRNYAAKHGWLPPLALEDVSGVEVETIQLDEVAVQRSISGDRSVHLNAAERREAVRELHSYGMSNGAIAKALDLTDRTVLRIRNELGLAANFDSGNNPVNRAREAS